MTQQSSVREQRELVRWIALLGAVTAEAAALHLGVETASARARLCAAQRAGLLAAHRPLTRQPALYTATASGLRACQERDLRTCRVSASGAGHLIVCASVAASLERCYPDARVVGERALRRLERARARELASAVLGETEYNRPRLHRPDLALLPNAPDGGLPIAVEVELTLKGPQRVERICRAWARSRCVAGVLYIGPPPVLRRLTRAIERAQADERIGLLALDAVVGGLARC